MGVLSRGEGNPSSGDNPSQILVLQVGGLLAKKARRGNAGQMILGRPRHVKRMKKELIDECTQLEKNGTE